MIGADSKSVATRCAWNALHRPLTAALALVFVACATAQPAKAPGRSGVTVDTYFRVKDSGQRALPGAALVTCATQVEPGPTPHSSSSTAPSPADIVVGPIRWPGLTRIATEDAGTYGDAAPDPRFVVVKAVMAISGTSAVTLSVPSEERDMVGLLYRRTDPTAIIRTPRDADGADTLQTRCGHDPTYYAGGFVVAPGRCANLDVFVANRPTALHGAISFGAGGCRDH